MEEQETKEIKEVVKLTKIEEAKLLIERLEKANADHRELLEREESIKTEKMVSGEMIAGQLKKTPEEQEQEKTQNLANEIVNAFK